MERYPIDQQTSDHKVGEHFKAGAKRCRGVVQRIGWPLMDQPSQPEAYLVHVWMREIHPMLWRRFLVRSDCTLADLHVLLQISFDWTDFHLHRFDIRKKG